MDSARFCLDSICNIYYTTKYNVAKIQSQKSFDKIKKIALASFATLTACCAAGMIPKAVALGGGILCAATYFFFSGIGKLSEEEIKTRNLRKLTPGQVKEKLKLHNRIDGQPTEFEKANTSENLNSTNDLLSRNLDIDFGADQTDWSHFAFEKTDVENASVAELRGKKSQMEDQYIMTTLQINLGGTTLPVPLYGVFDGNGGPQVAQFLKENIQKYLEEKLSKSAENGVLTDCAIFNVLKVAFVELINDYKEQSFPLQTGSTANIVLIIDGHLWEASVGDTRAVLFDGEKAIALSEDACADPGRFIPSVERRGGKTVLWKNPAGNVWRIDGLNMARNVSRNTHIPCRPKIIKYPLQDFKGQLVIACDGFWDVYSSNEAAAEINSKPSNELAEYFVKKAFLRGSLDNITVMAVDL